MASRQAELQVELARYKALMQSEIDRLEGRYVSWDDVRRERESIGAEVA